MYTTPHGTTSPKLKGLGCREMRIERAVKRNPCCASCLDPFRIQQLNRSPQIKTSLHNPARCTSLPTRRLPQAKHQKRSAPSDEVCTQIGRHTRLQHEASGMAGADMHRTPYTIGAFIFRRIRIGFSGILYYNYYEDRTPKTV